MHKFNLRFLKIYIPDTYFECVITYQRLHYHLHCTDEKMTQKDWICICKISSIMIYLFFFFFSKATCTKTGLGLNNVTGEKKKVNTVIKKQQN